MDYQYQKVVVGGTFDLLHAGHKKLLLKAFEIGEFISIGITTDKFVKHKNKEQFEDQETRLQNLENFLQLQNYNGRYEIIFIDDIFGTTLFDQNAQAIVVTQETQENARLINIKRSDQHFNPLEIITVPYELDQNGDIISSSRIKSGKISSDGKVYKTLLLNIAGKKFEETIRQQLKIPLGKFVTTVDQKTDIVTVGDVATKTILNMNVIPKLSVIDFKVQRKVVYKNMEELGFKKNKPDAIIKNPPGEISKDLILEIEKALKNEDKNQVILVEGEEDLAVIPAVLLGKLGILILYGQPKEGMVEIIVNQELKDKLCSILSR